jgi:peptide/nickel transport system substrate-binding protein
VGLVEQLRAGDPSQIGPFRLLGRLGEGGMGRVYLGESPGGRKVAVKVVHPHYANDPEFRRRFGREVATARQVGGFHTAAVVGADPDADPPWMATAYIPGPSLAQAVAEGGPLDEAGVRRLGAALAEGLAAIHECGLIHRDLKPGNVILADDGPRIIDFGIAKGANATALTGSSAVIGTLRYMSPEQLNGHELTPQSDVFALGTVLAYAATGHDPFQAPTIPAVITRILTGPPDLDPLTGDLRDIIGDCLAKDPGGRPSPGDLLTRFSDPAPRDLTVTAAPVPVPAPDPVPAAVPSPEPQLAEAGGLAYAAQEQSLASTANVSPVLPPGRTDPSAAQAAGAPRPARKPARRRSRRRTGLIAAGTTVVAIAGAIAAVIYVGLPGVPAHTPSANSPMSTASTGSGRASSALSPAPSTITKVVGGTATVALPSGVIPNYIWPYTPLTNANEYNAEGFQMLMYRPLYMFGNNGNSVTVNYPLSTADAPVYSNGDETVTITLKGWRWSDGETVDAADVMFWLNMMKAEPDNYFGYVPGLIPDNLASYSAAGPDTVVLNLKSAVSSIWFTYDQLAEITPMPEAWDVTSADAAPGSGGCSANISDCAAVYEFLSAQAQDTKTYATNPLWGVVDGPWKLSSFSTAASGPVASFAPNAAYSGSPKPQLAGVTYYAYTDDTTEYTALKTGQTDVGYIPPQDLAPVSGSQILPSTNPLGSAYDLSAAYSFGIQYFLINFNNPTLGPAYKQLYVRQAIQELIDQEGMIKSVDRGYGYPTSGGVPTQPVSQWVPSVQNQNGGQGPYAFSITNAMSLLTSHGWKEVGGVMTCETPSLCGAGVTAGTKLSMTMDYATGVTAFQQEVAIIKSDMSEAGIAMTLVPQSFNTIIVESSPCQPTQASCKWEILCYGGWNFNGPGFEPTGEPLFETGASSNSGSYSDATEDNLINATHTSSSLSAFQQYATYTAEQLPFIWMPSAYTVQAVNSKLNGVTFSPLLTLLPEYWYFTK